uniref:JmjC domain-containing protein n=1 Tax=Phaeomonas parva TaxID=124430 RepID=A0A7S1XSV0_9STRA
MEAPLYGADMEGSLFPEVAPSADPRARAASLSGAWNLRDLPSLLRLLPSRVPGVNSPMIYVGMFASLFAWHTEDADLFSINYLHTGAPKSWYAIRSADARRFESFASAAFQDKENECREYLRHKTSLLSPTLLRKRGGLEVTTVVQRAGEFVVTLPGSYHAGFNHGFNVAEATNFATPGWLDIGSAAGVCKCDPDSVQVDVERLRLLWENPNLTPKPKPNPDPNPEPNPDPDPNSKPNPNPSLEWEFSCSCGLACGSDAPKRAWPLGEMFQCENCDFWCHIGCNYPNLVLPQLLGCGPQTQTPNPNPYP